MRPSKLDRLRDSAVPWLLPAAMTIDPGGRAIPLAPESTSPPRNFALLISHRVMLPPEGQVMAHSRPCSSTAMPPRA